MFILSAALVKLKLSPCTRLAAAEECRGGSAMNLGKKNTAAVAVALAFTLAAGVATVFAVHDEAFELEGNIINDDPDLIGHA